VTEQEWLLCEEPEVLMNYLILNHPDFTHRKGRLFFCGCCRRFSNHFCHANVKTVLELIETYADKLLKRKDLVAQFRSLAASVSLTGTNDNPAEAAVFSLSDPGRVNARWLFYLTHLAAEQLGRADETARQADLARDVFGNPFRDVSTSATWATSTVTNLARAMYEDRAFDRLPILADALEEAGWADTDILNHCRGPGPHVRGCWVVDLILGKS
jgi:hypothetical protein